MQWPLQNCNAKEYIRSSKFPRQFQLVHQTANDWGPIENIVFAHIQKDDFDKVTTNAEVKWFVKKNGLEKWPATTVPNEQLILYELNQVMYFLLR